MSEFMAALVAIAIMAGVLSAGWMLGQIAGAIWGAL